MNLAITAVGTGVHLRDVCNSTAEAFDFVPNTGWSFWADPDPDVFDPPINYIVYC